MNRRVEFGKEERSLHGPEMKRGRNAVVVWES